MVHSGGRHTKLEPKKGAEILCDVLKPQYPIKIQTECELDMEFKVFQLGMVVYIYYPTTTLESRQGSFHKLGTSLDYIAKATILKIMSFL